MNTATSEDAALPEGVIHPPNHGMLGQQLLFPQKKLFVQMSQYRRRLHQPKLKPLD
jgi:hypothetical protein